MKKLYQWLCVNRLSLNIEKTNFIVFHPFNKPVKENITLLIHRKAIAETKFVKYLGVLMDSTLTWNFHIDNIAKKISRSIGILYKIRPFADLSVMTKLYYSIIYPHLIYAIQIWGSTFDNQIEKLSKLQKKALRVITNSNTHLITGMYTHSLPLFYSLKMLKIKEIYELQILTVIFDS